MPDGPLRVLTVCTANICRSPVAERVFQRQFDRAGVHAVVRSAGTHGGELAIAPEVVKAAAEIGIDLSDHRSRRLSAAIVRSADLIVAMNREHLRAVVELDSSSWPVTFTLKELYRRSKLLDAASMSIEDWIIRMNVGRRITDLLGNSTDDDLDDPYGGTYAGYQNMVAEVNRIVTVHPLQGRPGLY